MLPFLGGTGKVQIAAAAGILTVLIAVVAGAAMYVGSYLTERLGQSIGNDLRVRLYHHLQELSLAYYDTNRVGAILNTLTGDVQTIQSFASTSTLNILTDVLSLVGMIVVMFLLRWDFAFIALAVTRYSQLSRCASTRRSEPRSAKFGIGSPTCWRPCRKACSRSR